VIEALIIALYIVLGGLWRRIFGGWLHWKRYITISLNILATAPIWLLVPWWAALIAHGLNIAYWIKGHEWDHIRPMLLRYGPVGLYWRACILWWPEKWRLGGFIDGPTAVAEVLAGATVWGIYGSILVYLGLV
jgi:hypothetical protein